MMKALIIDLDGTIANNTHRQHYIEGDKKDWQSFNAAHVGDTLNTWCAEIMTNMGLNNYRIIIVSGRSDEFRNSTIQWLEYNTVPYDELYMRPAGDHRKDSVVKEEIYRSIIAPNYEVLFCIDDRQQVVDMWRSIGLVCLQCAKGDF